MSKNKKQLIPELRFPKFEGKWDEIKLGESINLLTDYHANGSYEKLKRNIELLDDDNYALMVRTTNFENKDFKTQAKYIKETAYNYLKKSKVYCDDIIINKIANAGATYLMPELNRPVSLAMNLFLLRIKNNFSSRYIYYQLKVKEPFLKSLARGTGVKTITKDDVKCFKISAPSRLEQQKIAAFLTEVDTEITKLTKKKTLLKQYKKGIMQKIFNQELRFKDDNGNDFPDWEEKKYNEIYTFYSTNSLSREKLNYESGRIYNIHYGDIHTKFSTLFNIKNELVPFVNNGVNLSKIKKESYLKTGDLLIADASEDYMNIGKTIEVVNLNGKKVISGLHTFHARPNKFKTATGFSGYMLQVWQVRKQVMKIAQGTKVLSLSTTRLGEIILSVPTISEQTKIANFLSDIDLKIEALNTKIENSKTFKKGVLQQMFV